MNRNIGIYWSTIDATSERSRQITLQMKRDWGAYVMLEHFRKLMFIIVTGSWELLIVGRAPMKILPLESDEFQSISKCFSRFLYLLTDLRSGVPLGSSYQDDPEVKFGNRMQEYYRALQRSATLSSLIRSSWEDFCEFKEFTSSDPLHLGKEMQGIWSDIQYALRNHVDERLEIVGLESIETTVIHPFASWENQDTVRLFDGAYHAILILVIYDFLWRSVSLQTGNFPTHALLVRPEADEGIVFSYQITPETYIALSRGDKGPEPPVLHWKYASHILKGDERQELSMEWIEFPTEAPPSTLGIVYHILQVTSSGRIFQRILKKQSTTGDTYTYELKLSLAWLSLFEEDKVLPQLSRYENTEGIREHTLKMVNSLLSWRGEVANREGRVWQPLPPHSKQVFATPLPTEGTDLDILMRTIQQHMLPYHLGNPDPRFFGWIMWWGNEIWALAHYIAAMMNPNAGVGNSVARYVEKQVIDWCKDMFLFPKNSVGILTSGGSLANQTPLMAAVDRYKKLHPGKRIRVYVSSQAHGSSQKWIQLQIGEEDIVKIPTWPDFKMDTAILEQQIQDDLDQWYVPAIAIGSMGTTNTGAIDDLEALIQLKDKHSLWLHVDGAYGAPAVGLSDQFSHLKPLFAQFDSLAVDFHKLLNVNYSVGLSLVKDPTVLYDAYGVNGQHYLNATNPDGISGWPRTKDDASLELTGPFSRSLSIWIIFQSLGRHGLVDMIDHQLGMAEYMEERIKEKCGHIVEIVTPRTLTVVCFSLKRGLDGDTSEQAISQANARMQELFEQRGNAIPSTTVLNGRTIIRACVSNHMTEKRDVDTLVDEIMEINAELTESSS